MHLRGASLFLHPQAGGVSEQGCNVVHREKAGIPRPFFCALGLILCAAIRAALTYYPGERNKTSVILLRSFHL